MRAIYSAKNSQDHSVKFMETSSLIQSCLQL
jgi:hypothetical protein